MYKKNLKEYFSIAAMQQEAEKGVCALENEDDIKTTIIYPIVDSAHGIYIPKLICKALKIDKCMKVNDDFYYDDFYHIEDEITESINQLIILPEGYNLRFSYNDNGDYCLFLNKYN